MSNIDWSQLITQEMKAATIAANVLANTKAELANRNAAAATQIALIQDRVDTLGYGVDAGEATEEDEAELKTLALILKAWKAYKFALGKVPTQPNWPTSTWPQAPAVPDIAGSPSALSPDPV